MPLISIIIPNYNGAEHLETSLRSINQQTFSDYEIIVVDNGSSDNSLSLINIQHQGVIVYRFNENRGFAAAVNHGIKNSKGRYIALLNNDIELDSQWLAKLAEAIECDNELGSVACKMLNYYERTIIDAAGDVLTKAGNTIGRGSGEKDTGQYDVTEYVFGACAGAGLYRREVFEKVGLYDEDYFAWFEDADHSFRSQMTGYKCLYVPSALCYHKRGATAKKCLNYPSGYMHGIICIILLLTSRQKCFGTIVSLSLQAAYGIGLQLSFRVTEKHYSGHSTEYS